MHPILKFLLFMPALIALAVLDFIQFLALLVINLFLIVSVVGMFLVNFPLTSNYFTSLTKLFFQRIITPGAHINHNLASTHSFPDPAIFEKDITLLFAPVSLSGETLIDANVPHWDTSDVRPVDWMVYLKRLHFRPEQIEQLWTVPNIDARLKQSNPVAQYLRTLLVTQFICDRVDIIYHFQRNTEPDMMAPLSSPFHPLLIDGFSKLYGIGCDANKVEAISCFMHATRLKNDAFTQIIAHIQLGNWHLAQSGSIGEEADLNPNDITSLNYLMAARHYMSAFKRFHDPRVNSPAVRSLESYVNTAVIVVKPTDPVTSVDLPSNQIQTALHFFEKPPVIKEDEAELKAILAPSVYDLD